MTIEARRTANRHPEHLHAIRAAIRPHALLDGHMLTFCRPSAIEAAIHPPYGRPGWTGNNGKICFGDEAAAQAAADDIADIDGADPVIPYACPRGGHYHHVSLRRRLLTAENAVARMAAAARRVARQVA